MPAEVPTAPQSSRTGTTSRGDCDISAVRLDEDTSTDDGRELRSLAVRSGRNRGHIAPQDRHFRTWARNESTNIQNDLEELRNSHETLRRRLDTVSQVNVRLHLDITVLRYEQRISDLVKREEVVRGRLEFEWIQYLMNLNTVNVHDTRGAVKAAEETSRRQKELEKFRQEVVRVTPGSEADSESSGAGKYLLEERVPCIVKRRKGLHVVHKGEDMVQMQMDRHQL